VVAAIDAIGPLPELASSRRKISTGPPPMLTTAAERRLVSVILLAPYGTPGPDSTVQQAAWAKMSTIFPQIKEISFPFGADVEAPATGAVIATLASTASATDQAARAARCALAMRAVAQGVPMALATGRSVMAPRHGLPMGDAIDRAVLLLKQRAAEGD